MIIPKPKYKRRVPRAKNNPVPTEPSECFICHRIGLMQTHECFGGSGKRQLSIRLGLQVKLCDTCHKAVTENVNMETVREIKEWGQFEFEKTHSREEFLKLFNRNYLD